MLMSDSKLRLRRFHRLELRLLLSQWVDIRHNGHGILVAEQQPFVLHEVC